MRAFVCMCFNVQMCTYSYTCVCMRTCQVCMWVVCVCFACIYAHVRVCLRVCLRMCFSARACAHVHVCLCVISVWLFALMCVCGVFLRISYRTCVYTFVRLSVHMEVNMPLWMHLITALRMVIKTRKWYNSSRCIFILNYTRFHNYVYLQR